MEFAAAALSAIGSTFAGAGTVANGAIVLGGAAGPGVFGASAGLGASLGGLSTAASILSGGATVASVLMANQAGQQQAAALNMQASDAEMSARLEQVQGLQRRNSIKAALVDAIGERDVAAAASGVDLSFGTPAIARDQAQIEGSRALTVDQNTESFNRSRLFERAANYRTMAKQASAGGLGKAATLALEGGAKLARRG